MSEHDRDLALAIHHEIISPERVDAALTTWQQNQHLDERARMWVVLANASGLSCDAVLARRQREAARTGPWEEEDGYPGSLVPPGWNKRGAP